ncbi:MAG TPA: AAA family ATPase, partial [Trebonia sp.]|nr:AAA family ATPase [Trebonia sp.]
MSYAWWEDEPARAPGVALDGNPVAERLAHLRAALLDSAALDAIQPPEPVIDGFLYRDSLAWLHGKPGNGKSFVALDWAACTAAGLPWQEHEVIPGPVLYLAAEGTSGLRQRVRAWEDYAKCTMGALFLPLAVQILVPGEREALAALAAGMRPALVVLDTQARVTAGFDENSAKDMGLYVAAADRIRAASGACVLTVHHEARNGDNMRGSTALEGAATSIMRTAKDGSLITLSTAKQKDAPAADDVRLRLVPRLGSAVIMSHEMIGTFGLMTDSETTVMSTLWEFFAGRSATTSEVIETSKLGRTTVYRALSSLVSKGKVVNTGSEVRPRYVVAGTEIPNVPQRPVPLAPESPTSHHPFRGGTDGTL